ncbi:YvcK family protein [Candidatus Gottesmanbacteria bacterium]|nr:YvcK family protein [Candidatus Gottesmanbacteria bacterium]
MKKDQKIVCLGGGIGTVQLLRGLRSYSKNITVVCSMADDGGSGGRLRRLFSIPPPGDLINCLAALSEAEPILRQLLTFRFAGDRWGKDDSLRGQKLGNLILVALTSLTGSFEKGLKEAERLFSCHGQILPATQENVSIWAKTVEGKRIFGEENIDLGKYNGIRALSEVHLEPRKVSTPVAALTAIKEADSIIAGPGDLYTTILPVLLVPQIKQAIKKSKGGKIFVINVANKPFETPHYKISDYLNALKKHCEEVFFDYILVNTNFKPELPFKLNYEYVAATDANLSRFKVKVVKRDLVEPTFPLYHNPEKIARAILAITKK